MRDFAVIEWLCKILSPIETQISQRTIDDIATVSWPDVIRVAGDGLVTPSLAAAFKRRGLLEALPTEIQDYFLTVQALNQQRNTVLRDALHSATQTLNELGIQPMVLKGAINLVTPQYPGSNDRLIGDLDLLVPEERLQEAYQAFSQQVEYRVKELSDFTADVGTNHHAPAILHKTLPIKIELHRQLITTSWQYLIPAASTLQNGVTIKWEGVELKLPDPTTRVIHTFVHTQLQDGNHTHRRIALRPLLEFASQRQALENEINWEAAVSQMEFADASAFLAYLYSASTLFSQSLPGGMGFGYREKWHLLQIDKAMSDPRYYKLFYWLPRLKRLPQRLVTPSWYVEKYAALRC